MGVWGQGYIWPKVSPPKLVPNLAMRCLSTGEHGGGVGDIWLKVILLKVVPNLVMRCLLGDGGIWGLGAGVHMTKGQSAQCSTKFGHGMSTEGGDIGGLGVRGLGYIWPQVSMPNIVPNGAMISELGGGVGMGSCWGRGYIWPKVSWPEVVPTPGHEVPLPWGTSEQRSACPEVPLLATRCLYWGLHLTKGQPDLK